MAPVDGNGAEQGRRQYRHLRCSALQSTGRGIGHVHETLSRLAGIEHGAEYHEDGYYAYRYPGQFSPDTTLGYRHCPHEAVERQPRMAEFAGNTLPEQAVGQRRERDQRQRPADRSARHFEYDQ
jgi:hypothetical protein